MNTHDNKICAWEALENSGDHAKTYSGSMGVCGGVGGINTSMMEAY